MNKRSLLAGPYIVWIIGFTVLPLLMIIFYALGDGRGEMTMSNILAIFEPVHLKALLLALWLAILCTGICLVLAYPLALILRKLNIGKQGMMAIIVILPMWVNFILRIMAWQLLLSRNGLINGALGAIGLPGQDLANSSMAIVIGMVYDYLPFMILPVYNAVTDLKDDVIEAARDLGAPPKAVLTRIMIPLTKPGIISGITMVFVPSLTAFAIPDILGGGKVMLIGNIIEQEFSTSMNWHLGSGLSIALMIFVLISMIFTSKKERNDAHGKKQELFYEILSGAYYRIFIYTDRGPGGVIF